MEILRDDRDNLNKKLNEKELESISTNKVTEREMQNQYLTQISLLQEKLKDCEREIKKLVCIWKKKSPKIDHFFI